MSPLSGFSDFNFLWDGHGACECPVTIDRPVAGFACGAWQLLFELFNSAILSARASLSILDFPIQILELSPLEPSSWLLGSTNTTIPPPMPKAAYHHPFHCLDPPEFLQILDEWHEFWLGPSSTDDVHILHYFGGYCPPCSPHHSSSELVVVVPSACRCDHLLPKFRDPWTSPDNEAFLQEPTSSSDSCDAGPNLFQALSMPTKLQVIRVWNVFKTCKGSSYFHVHQKPCESLGFPEASP